MRGTRAGACLTLSPAAAPMTATPAKREARAAVDRLALKENDQFLVADASGDIDDASDGLFLADTRVLSRLTLDIGGRRPALLSAGVSHDNVLFRAHLTNERLPELGGDTAPGGVIHIERIMLLWDRRLYEQITLTNYGDQVVAVPVGLRFAVDFHDIFEVRGWRRDHRGRLLRTGIFGARIEFQVRGARRARPVLDDRVFPASRPPYASGGAVRLEPSAACRALPLSRGRSGRERPAGPSALPSRRGAGADRDARQATTGCAGREARAIPFKDGSPRRGRI